MADDLDDDFYISEPVVADEGEGDSGNDINDKVSEDENQTVSEITSLPIKRPSSHISPVDDQPPKKKKKRKRKRITEELAKNKPTNAKKDDLFNFVHSNFDGKLSSVEWDDLKLNTDKDVFESNQKGKPPSEYCQEILPKWEKMLQTPLKAGSPLVIVLTASAIRAVELNRDLNDFKTKKCKTAKLFGKHLKVSEQQQYLSKNICHVAVGTPLRVLNLIKSESLKLNKLVAVILDWNKRDVKSKRMIDIPEVKQALLDLLKGGLVSAVHNSQSKFAIL
ncbi:hypothetical protein LOTGIDRAFT_210347, partial [Lottia gigantea]